jgi:hypothetical protein
MPGGREFNIGARRRLWIVLIWAQLAFGLEPAQAEGDPVLVGAGDISSCATPGDWRTAALLDKISGTVFTVGDNAYDTGTFTEFQNCYHPTWGRHKGRTRPALGNHEARSKGAAGYYRYFGAAAGPRGRGYYSYNLGDWHIVVLDSTCVENAGGCKAGSKQEHWLRADLAAHPRKCTLAYWHHPRFSSSDSHGSTPRVGSFWRALYEYGADVVLSGHDHVYERFAPQTPTGQADARFGIRQFVVGTGGVSLNGFRAPLPHSQVRNANTYGVVELTLHDNSYDWRFVPEAGKSFRDSGRGSCHGRPGDD